MNSKSVFSPSSTIPETAINDALDEMEPLNLGHAYQRSEMKNICKFGGTSVGSPERLSQVVSIISKERNSLKAVVVSAMGKSTDHLIQATDLAALGKIEQAHKIIDQVENLIIQNGNETKITLNSSDCRKDVSELVVSFLQPLRQLLLGISLLREKTPQALDTILSFGERLSAMVLSHLLNSSGVPAVFVDAREWVTTDANFGRAKVNYKDSKTKLLELSENWGNQLPIVTGFIGMTSCGRTTTLGRNGSDYTATLLGNILKANYVIINTDICGVMTADPRIVQRACPVSQLSHHEALELAIYGNRMFHSRTMLPLIEGEIPMIIRNTMDPSGKGTLISSLEKNTIATCTTSLENLAIFEIRTRVLQDAESTENQCSHIGRRASQCLEAAKIRIWLSIRAAHGQAVTLVLPIDMKEKAKEKLLTEFQREIDDNELDEIKVTAPVTMLSIVGDEVHNSDSIAARFFMALGTAGVSVLAVGQGTSSRSLSCIIKGEDTKLAVQRVHDAFNLSVLDVQLILLGANQTSIATLEQIKEQMIMINKQYGIQLRLVGFGSKSTPFQLIMNGMDIDSTIHILKQSPIDNWDCREELEMLHSTPTEDDLDIIKEFSCPIVVDCSGSCKVSSLYSSCFQRGIHVVASNARSVCGYTESHGTHLSATLVDSIGNPQKCFFLYDSAVGASLPVLDTLSTLLRTGDRLLKIEAALSGSIDFISSMVFNGCKLSHAVQEAIKHGYTEADPVSDLLGKDVANKLRVLTRALKLNIPLANMHIEPFIPKEIVKNLPSCENNAEYLIKSLQNYDDEFDRNLVAPYNKNGYRLLYLATIIIENGNSIAKIKCEHVDSTHPLYHIQDNNVGIAFTTQRFESQPLVLTGSGTGGMASSAGVLGDIIKISNKLKGNII